MGRSVPNQRFSALLLCLFISTYSFAQITLPYFEDFESDNGGWTTGGTNSSWEYGLTTSGSKGWATNLDGDYNNSETSYIESPVLDFSGLSEDPFLHFDLSYDIERGWDDAWLEVSVDGGSTYTKISSSELGYYSADGWSDDGELTGLRLTLDTLAGKSQVSFRISFKSDGSVFASGIIFDNFEIFGQPESDIALVALPMTDYSASISEEYLSIDIANYGTSSVSSVPLSITIFHPDSTTTQFSETASITISPDDTVSYVLTQAIQFSDVGYYSVTVDLSNSDDYNSNNSAVAVTKKIDTYTGSLPYTADFESVTLGDYQPTLDTIEGAKGFGYIASSSNGRLGIFQSLSSYEGNSLKLSRAGTGTTTNELIWTFDGSSYSVASDVILLDFAFSAFNPSYGTDDVIMIRGSESDEWVSIYNWYDNRPPTSKWKRVSYFNLSQALADASQDFSAHTQIRFTEKDDYAGDYFGLDDFKVFVQAANDVAISNVTVPDISSSLGATEDITLEVTNYGKNQQTSIPVVVAVDGPDGIQEETGTLTTALDSGQSAEITLSGLFDFTKKGDYAVTAYTSLATDTKHDIDTMTDVPVYSQWVYDGSLPYELNFDAESSQTVFEGSGKVGSQSGLSFLADGYNGTAQIDDYSGISYSGKSMFLSSSNSSLYVVGNLYINLDLSSKTVASDQIIMDFKFRSRYVSSADSPGVYVRGNEADEWLLLYDWYANKVDQEWVSADFLNITDTLAAHGQEFSSETQIRFRSRTSSVYPNGLALDEINIYERPALDLRVLAIETPQNQVELGSAENISVQILNRGLSGVADIPVNIEITGPGGTVEASETIAGTLASSDTVDYTFNQTVDFSTPGVYQVKVFTSLDGDADLDTDTLSVNKERLSVATALPFTVNFNNISDTTYTENQQQLGGIEGLAYQKSEEWAFAEVSSTYAYNGQSLKMSRDDYQAASNALIVTLDMSAYDVSTNDFLLDYRYTQYGEEVHSEDQVFVRGSESDEWIVIHNWSDNLPSSRSWVTVTGLSISDTLSANGQSYSASTQIKFGEYDTYPDEDLYLDDIRIYESAATDINLFTSNLTGITTTRESTIDLNVSIANRGSQAQTSIPMGIQINGPNGSEILNETLTVSLNADDTVDVDLTNSLDVSEIGSYDVVLYTALAGDEYQDNDTLRYTFNKLPRYDGGLPYLEDFEATSEAIYEGSTNSLPFAGWTFETDSDDRGRLEVGQHVDSTSQSVFMSIGSSGYTQDNLILTADLSANVGNDIILGFDFSHISGSDYFSYTRVYVRGSEDDSWLTLYNWYANRPSQGEWEYVRSLAVSDLLTANGQSLTESFQVRFRMMDYSSGEGFVLDNITLDVRPDNDVQVLSAELPDVTANLTATESISVDLFNNGAIETTEVPLTIEVDGPNGSQTVTETAAIAIARLDTGTYTFTEQFDFTTAGTYTLKIYDGLVDDPENRNDTISYSMYRKYFYAGDYPYFEDFESDSAGFRAYGTNSSWVYDTLDTGDQKGWVTRNESGEHNNSELSYLETPVFDLTGMNSQPLVSFDLKVNLESCCDELWLEYSLDGGETYTKVLSEQLAYNRGDDFWNGNREVKVTLLNLPELLDQSKVVFRFVLDTDGSVTKTGVQVDNFHLLETPANELAMVSTGGVISPTFGTAEHPTITITNFGTDAITSVDFGMRIISPAGDTVNIAETVSVSLASGDTLTHALSTDVDLSAKGDHDLKAYAKITGDQFAENDTVRGKMIHQGVYAESLPYVQDFNQSGFGSFNTTTAELSTFSELSFIADKGVLNFSYSGSSYYSHIYSDGKSQDQMVATLNLSDYTVADNELLLNTDIVHSDSQADTMRAIYVRGSSEDVWLLLEDLGEHQHGGSTLEELRGLNISSLLSANGQDFSETFQISFSSNDTYIYSSYTYLNVYKIEVFERPGHDIDVSALAVPESGFEVNTSQEVTATLINQGGSSESDIPLTFYVQDSEGVQEFSRTVSGPMATGDTLVVNANLDYDFSEDGTYIISAVARIASDTTALNDSLTSVLVNQSIYNSELPLTMTFESLSDTAYTTSRGVVGGVQGLDYKKGNGQLMVQTGEDTYLRLGRSSYQSDLIENALVLTMDLSDLDTATNDLVFDLDFKFRTYNNSRSSIFVRGDTSAQWMPFYDFSSEQSNTLIHKEFLPLRDSLRSYGQNFSTTTQIKFMERNTSTSYYFDLHGLEIYERSPQDVAPSNIATTLIAYDHTGSSLSVDLINKGSADVSAIPITAKAVAEDGTEQTLTGAYTATLAVLDTATFTFDSYFDLTDAGRYEVMVYAGLAEDGRRSNDTLRTEVYTRSNSTLDLPYYQSFDTMALGTFDGISYEIPGLSGWSYQNMGTTYLAIDTAKNEPTGKSLLVKNAQDQVSNTELVFTQDLSDYSVANQDELILEMQVNTYTSYRDDLTLYIRGDVNSEWIAMGSDIEYFDEYHLSDSLSANGQDFSATTQFKMEFLLHYNYSTFWIDNFWLYNLSDNVAPQTLTLSSDTVQEESSTDQFVGVLSADDPDEPLDLQYSLTFVDGDDDRDNFKFHLKEDSLFLDYVVDFETDSILNVNIRVTDSHEAFLDQAFEIRVLDVNEPLTGLTLSNSWVYEANEDTVLVGELIPTDEDLHDSYNFELVNDDLGPDNDRLILDGAMLYVKQPDYESKNTFDFHVQVTEASGTSVDLSSTINVNNVNEPPTAVDIQLETINEDAYLGQLVATFSATDLDEGDNTFTYFIDDTNRFAVSGNTMITATTFDIDEELTIPVELTVKDQVGDSLTVGFDVVIIDLIELGVEDEQLMVYPNPVMNELHIQNSKVTRVQVYSLSGIEIDDKSLINTKTLDTSDWQSGVYLLRVWVDDQYKDLKIIKK